MLVASIIWNKIFTTQQPQDQVKVASSPTPIDTSQHGHKKDSIVSETSNKDGSKKTIDSLERIVKQSFDWNDGAKRKLRYMKACYALGKVYETEFEKGNEPDMKKALYYYEKVAILSDGTDSDLGWDTELISYRDFVLKRIAEIYYTNKGTKKFQQKAKHWYELSAEQGDEKAAEKLEAIIAKSSKDSINGFSLRITFASSPLLFKRNRLLLSNYALIIKNNPNKRFCVTGRGGYTSYTAQQFNWEQAEAVIKYLVENEGINRESFVFRYGESGGNNIVDLEDCTGDDGPNRVPAPHPGMSKYKKIRN